ncbi:hypothetical protein HAX54_037112 [Datura stramonium]|uniref:Uncharacterized protein n=1 Tax=Datura stramonium TaxID=4076 RepID=A0ABS8VHW6_DATST|nr:hypothetical protein [Datura stramonium]
MPLDLKNVPYQILWTGWSDLHRFEMPRTCGILSMVRHLCPDLESSAEEVKTICERKREKRWSENDQGRGAVVVLLAHVVVIATVEIVCYRMGATCDGEWWGSV